MDDIGLSYDEEYLPYLDKLIEKYCKQYMPLLRVACLIIMFCLLVYM